MPGIPVVIASNGLGIPVRQVESGAPVMTVAANGLGMPIVLSDRGTPFVVEGGVDPNAIPQLSRVATTGAYDSTGNATVVSNLSANAPRSHYLISFTAGVERTVGWQVGPAGITGKGCLLYLSNNLAANDLVISTIVFEESFDSTNYVDGSWSTISWSAYKPPQVTLSNPYMIVGQIIEIASGPARKIRMKVNNTTGSNISIRVALMQRPEAGIPDDVVLLAGPSLMSPTTSRSAIDVLNAITGNIYDPIVIMAAQSGLYADEVAAALSDAWDRYPYIATAFADVGGNDISAYRPYSTDPNKPNTLNGLITCHAKAAENEQRRFGSQSITYRNYPAPNAVNVFANPENGSYPYNFNSVLPWMGLNMLDLWEAEYGIPQCDLYSAWAYTYDTSLLPDGIHGTSAGYIIYRNEGFGRYYSYRKSLVWTESFVPRTIASLEIAGTITAEQKLRLEFCMSQWPLEQNTDQVIARVALGDRLDDIPVSG